MSVNLQPSTLESTSIGLAAPPHSRFDDVRAALTGWTYRIVLLGSAAIALHLLDDAFVHNAPGTRASDHLVSGVLAVALVGAFAGCYPWLKNRSRAALSLLLGVLAAGVGVMTHGERLLNGERSVNDLTGALLIAGGLALVGAGIILTHRAITHPVRRGWRWFGRRSLVIGAAVVTINYLCLPVWIASFATHPRQSDLPVVDLGVPYNTVNFGTDDGLTLSGWFIPSRNGATIVTMPGASNDRTGVAEHAAMLARHGYGVLLFDPRGMGASDGDPNQFGWYADRDISAALAFLQQRPDVDPERIGAFGLSMGGEALVQATAEQPLIRAVVADGVGSRNLDESLLLPGIGKWISLPQTWLGYELTSVLSGVDPAPSLNDLIQRIAPRPLLLIYASGSHQSGEARLNPIYFASAGEPKEIWPIDDAGHTEGYATHPEAYEERVIAFLNRALLAEAQ
jgi:fermentation-respiration switch protein FrsA (DUF1100 family)